MTAHSPYEPPRSRVHASVDPQRLAAIAPVLLQRAAWVCVVFIAIELVLFAVQFSTMADGVDPGTLPLVRGLSVVYTVLFLHVLNVFRGWLEQRFEFRGARSAIAALMVVNVIFVLVELVATPNEPGSENLALVVAMLVAGGLIQIVFGLRLLQVHEPYPHMRGLALTSIASGVCLVTVILFFIAVVVGIAGEILLARVLFHAAHEASMSDGPASAEE